MPQKQVLYFNHAKHSLTLALLCSGCCSIAQDCIHLGRSQWLTLMIHKVLRGKQTLRTFAHKPMWNHVFPVLCLQNWVAATQDRIYALLIEFIWKMKKINKEELQCDVKLTPNPNLAQPLRPTRGHFFDLKILLLWNNRMTLISKIDLERWSDVTYAKCLAHWVRNFSDWKYCYDDEVNGMWGRVGEKKFYIFVWILRQFWFWTPTSHSPQLSLYMCFLDNIIYSLSFLIFLVKSLARMGQGIDLGWPASHLPC